MLIGLMLMMWGANGDARMARVDNAINPNNVVVIVVSNDIVTKIDFACNYSQPYDSFNLYYGSRPGTYTDLVSNIKGTNFSLIKTNWNEADVRHYFTLRTIRMGIESVPSNEIWWPPLDYSHITLEWPNTTLSNGIVEFNNIIGSRTNIKYLNTNYLVLPIDYTKNHFFILTNNTGPLNIKPFNPTNALIYGETNYWTR